MKRLRKYQDFLYLKETQDIMVLPQDPLKGMEDFLENFLKKIKDWFVGKYEKYKNAILDLIKKFKEWIATKPKEWVALIDHFKKGVSKEEIEGLKIFAQKNPIDTVKEVEDEINMVVEKNIFENIDPKFARESELIKKVSDEATKKILSTGTRVILTAALIAFFASASAAVAAILTAIGGAFIVVAVAVILILIGAYLLKKIGQDYSNIPTKSKFVERPDDNTKKDAYTGNPKNWDKWSEIKKQGDANELTDTQMKKLYDTGLEIEQNEKEIDKLSKITNPSYRDLADLKVVKNKLSNSKYTWDIVASKIFAEKDTTEEGSAAEDSKKVPVVAEQLKMEQNYPPAENNLKEKFPNVDFSKKTSIKSSDGKKILDLDFQMRRKVNFEVGEGNKVNRIFTRQFFWGVELDGIYFIIPTGLDFFGDKEEKPKKDFEDLLNEIQQNFDKENITDSEKAGEFLSNFLNSKKDDYGIISWVAVSEKEKERLKKLHPELQKKFFGLEPQIVYDKSYARLDGKFNCGNIDYDVFIMHNQQSAVPQDIFADDGEYDEDADEKLYKELDWEFISEKDWDIWLIPDTDNKGNMEGTNKAYVCLSKNEKPDDKTLKTILSKFDKLFTKVLGKKVFPGNKIAWVNFSKLSETEPTWKIDKYYLKKNPPTIAEVYNPNK